MKDQTAEEIVRRYWRGFQFIRALRWVGCLVCILAVFRSVWRMPDDEWKMFLLLALYLLYLRLLRVVNSFRFLSLNQLLLRDCDAVKFAEVSRLLGQKLGKRSTGMAGLNAAWGTYWSGRFEEAEAALTDVDLRGKSAQGRLLLRNLDFNCRMARGDTAGAGDIRRETERYVSGLKRGGDRKAGERLLTLMDGSLALEAGDYETFRTIEARLEAGNTTTFQRVVAADGLARADLAQGERENARARLEFAAANGGTLYVAERARRLLAEMTES